MTIDRQTLDGPTAALLDTLSKTPTQQLAIVITQHASLPKHTSRALRILSRIAIEAGTPLAGEERTHADRIANVLRRLIDRGDPSQARRLLPGQTAMIDLAVCVDAQDILARLMDRTAVEEALRAAIDIFGKADKSDHTQVQRSAYILARVAFSLPLYEGSQGVNLQRRNVPKQAGIMDLNGLVKILNSLAQAHASVAYSTGDSIGFSSKVCVLDATWALFNRYFRKDSSSKSSDVEKILSSLSSQKDMNRRAPLIDLTLIEDLSIIKPLVPLLRRFASQSKLLDALARRISQILTGQATEFQLHTLGQAWQAVIANVPKNSQSTASESVSHINAELEASILAILPYWQANVQELRQKLSQPPYADQSNDMVVQMLMDEGEASKSAKDSSQLTRSVPDPMNILRQRANIFDDDLSSKRMTKAKGKGRAAEKDFVGAGLSDDLKASILMRAEAPDSDEEDRLEWDPFAAGEGGREIGFEEELAEYGGKSVTSSHVTKKGDGSESESDDDVREEGEADGRYGASGHGQGNLADGHPTSRATATAAERAAERLLISAWKEQGKELFARATRKTPGRSSLLAHLNHAKGKQWDDQLVESWGTMFERNPRKEKLLAAADDILRSGNPNRISRQAAGEEDQGSSHPFGVDRGRGGRILTAANGRGQGRGRGAGGRGKGRGSRGHHRGSGPRGGGGGGPARG